MEKYAIPQGDITDKIYAPTPEKVRLQGRAVWTGSAAWLVTSASGVAFEFYGNKAVITMVGDESCKGEGDYENYCRFAVYVDGQRVLSQLMDRPEAKYAVYTSAEPKWTTVQVIKLSEAPMSTVGVKEILVGAAGDIRPTDRKDLFVEFIGDSITCGYGVDDENPVHVFKTSSEDATKSYAFKTAELLGADYSYCSYSGYGIISGYTTDGNAIPFQTVPQYYDKLGFSYRKFQGKAPQDQPWKDDREPDLIVLNLGTNDSSYTDGKEDRILHYSTEYVAFLKKIRSIHPSSKIACVLGLMGQALCEGMENAVKNYKAETGDEKIAFLWLEEQLEEDGRVADWHPTEVSHTKAAEKLSAFLKDFLA